MEITLSVSSFSDRLAKTFVIISSLPFAATEIRANADDEERKCADLGEM
jgi:hypothetical protein